mmetsp:Transcript_14679/g.40569  ORF Transcript_14679/g.40569 Transcript_14679/m.40569 type:complete len:222 (-) Transcript_14679:1468-2133(-)
MKTLSITTLFSLAVGILADDDGFVTCGSAVKMTHVESGMKKHDSYFLNSEAKSLGGGSGQQIVTAVSNPTTTNALWLIRAPNSDRSDVASACQDGPGTPIRCGSSIRLTHLNTMRNLHSHGQRSPLSRQQEVTAYGEGDGRGDAGDDWMVVCDGEHWQREKHVQFQHVDTGKYLGASSTVQFTQQNCGRQCPIMNHLEIFGRGQKDGFSKFVVEMGVHLSK